MTSEDQQDETAVTSRLLDMTQVKVRELAAFDHPRLARARRDLAEVVEARRVVAGFGSAI